MSARATRFLALWCLVAASAHAAIYESQIIVEDEDDLFALEQRGDISSDQLDSLLEVFREGVDLNSASRDQLYDLPGITYADCDAIIEYRKSKGRIDDPAELVAAGAITAEQLLELAPFIRIDAAKPKLPVSGKIRSVTRLTTTDNAPPPSLLSANVKLPWNLSAGFMLATTRLRPATPTYDPTLGTLVTTGFPYMLNAPRFFAMWSSGKRKLVVGTFTLGFGERLTLDNTRRLTPNGIYLTNDFRRTNFLVGGCKISSPDQLSGPCAPDQQDKYVTPDFSWREQFRGVAGSIEDISLGGDATLSTYGFLSYQSRSMYQYELFDRAICDDPHGTGDECKSPPVYLPDGVSTTKYATLPYLFDELTGGGHVTFKPSYRFSLGVTGYGAVPFFHAQPIQLDFQEWSRYPNGGAFGAIGLNGHATIGPVNMYLEIARTFDHSIPNGGGGLGIEQRTTFSPHGHELEVSLRYYDDRFGNPYARPIASPDQLEGIRARNELGIRVRYYGRFGKDWELKTRNDFWVSPYATTGAPAMVPNLFTMVRANFRGWRLFQPSVWIDLRNRNLLSSQHGNCASTASIASGDPADPQYIDAGNDDLAAYTNSCDRYKAVARLDFNPHQRVQLATQASIIWVDDLRYKDRFRNDLQIWGEVNWRPIDWLQFHLRSRYVNQDVSDQTYLQTYLWTYLDTTVSIAKFMRIGFRYDLFAWLDQRTSTIGTVDGDGNVVGARVPNPENRLMLDVRANF